MALFPTLQDVFNKAWQAFVIGHRPQAVAHGVCVYRGGDDKASDTRCVIGVCLPDDLYDPDMEHHGIHNIADQWPETYDQVFNGIEVDELAELQDAHDSRNSETEDGMRRSLEYFAEHYSLTIPGE